MSCNHVGLLLVNLGTPDSPSQGDVRRYLKQFLLDPRVIDIGSLKRQLLVRLLILPRRPKATGAAYRAIWEAEGSPLLNFTLGLAKKVQERVADHVMVVTAMRYGQPSIEEGLLRLRRMGADRVVVFPLYPHYASASTGSTLEMVYRQAAALWNTPFLSVIPPFFDHSSYIKAFAAVGQRTISQIEADHVLFSYHGLPERHCKKSDFGGNHCLVAPDCCAAISRANRMCYRAQCYETTRRLVAALGLADGEFTTTFQSRLGRDPWIRPYTDEAIPELVRRGIRRVAVFSPAFVADCLETLEELQIQAAESFIRAGGDKLALVPSLNDRDEWADAVVSIAAQHSSWIPCSV